MVVDKACVKTLNKVRKEQPLPSLGICFFMTFIVCITVRAISPLDRLPIILTNFAVFWIIRILIGSIKTCCIFN